MSFAPTEHARLMDRVYRHQRHIYDATRKYYLLGRDEMLAGLNVPRNGTVLEIGCGTGRNLVKAGSLYPTARLFGVDISREMLATSAQSISRAGLAANLAVADATTFDPNDAFARTSFDRIYFSYAVSMIPAWEAAISRALEYLAPGGELHVVDFGDLAGLPGWSKRALYTWLRWYHVTPRGDLFQRTSRLASARGFAADEKRIFRGFAWVSVIKRPDPLFDPRDAQTASVLEAD